MKITRFKTLESTNQYLQNLLNEGIDIVDNIVVTDYQTSGKGQGKNVWESEDGKNIREFFNKEVGTLSIKLPLLQDNHVYTNPTDPQGGYPGKAGLCHFLHRQQCGL